MMTDSGATEGRLLVARSGLYISVVLSVVLGASVHSLRDYSLFACEATGYGSDGYLAYCGSPGYGDYDYGAFWFGLEPEATNAAAAAQVLFVGNSRMQFGLSSDAMAGWFEGFGVSHYLLGFAYNGNYRFLGPLLGKLQPKAQVVVINLDLFFEQNDTEPARIVMQDSSARVRYEKKRWWQPTHQSACLEFSVICGHDVAFFRSRPTGAWRLAGGQFKSGPVSFDGSIDHDVLEVYASQGARFLSSLPVGSECQILTMVPSMHTAIGTAKAIAATIGRPLVAPELTGLNTFDESHLDSASAERWSTAFIHAAAPYIQKCLFNQVG